MPSVREQEAAKFRAQMIARENAAIRFMEAQWRNSAKRIQADIDKIVAKIDKARRNGERVNPDWLRRQAEYKRLQQQLIREANQYSARVAAQLKVDIRFGAEKGIQQMSAMHELTFTNPQLSVASLDAMGISEPVREALTFRALPSEAIRDIAARVTPRSPAGKILGKLGREAAKESRKVLIDGVTRGRNVKVIARELEKVANLPKSRAMTIARTEIFGAYTDAMHEQMKQDRAVGDEWVWVCQLGSACGGCLAMHGQTISVDSFMKKHPNCHCEPMQVPKSWSALGFPPEMDRKFPPTIDPDKMKQDALAEIRGKSVSQLQERFGVGKGALLHSGEVKLSQLATVTENKIWGGATVETPLKYLVK